MYMYRYILTLIYPRVKMGGDVYLIVGQHLHLQSSPVQYSTAQHILVAAIS
jgi:hypothetical protein